MVPAITSAPTENAFSQPLQPTQTSTSAASGGTPVAPENTPTRPVTAVPSPTQPVPTNTPSEKVLSTSTSLAPGACPAETGASPSIALEEADEFVGELETQIQSYLNTRGNPTGLKYALETLSIPGERVEPLAAVKTADLTGNTTPEVIVGFMIHFVEYQFEEGGVFVFTCQEGLYKSLPSPFNHLASQHPSESDGIRAIRDMNHNGKPEMILSIVSNVGVHGYFDRLFWVYEWDGAKFVDLIQPGPLTQIRAEAFNGDGQIRDVDGDGTFELVISHGIAPHYIDEGPQRERTDVWAWNGEAFTLVHWEHVPPVYRFQAVYDGDDATQFGFYDEALDFYQRAIFDEKLLGWNQGQLWPDSAYGDQPTPSPDPNERPRLEAYARYRIVLLHASRGFSDDAKVVYETLQNKFPPGSSGHPYAALAQTFWNTYLESGEVGRACEAAIAYASARQSEILHPLDSHFYGFSQPTYQPEDICPF